MQPHLVRDFPAIAMVGVVRLRARMGRIGAASSSTRALEQSNTKRSFGSKPQKLNGCGASEWAKRRDRDLRATQAAQPQGDPQTPRLLPKIETMFAQIERRSAS